MQDKFIPKVLKFSQRDRQTQYGGSWIQYKVNIEVDQALDDTISRFILMSLTCLLLFNSSSSIMNFSPLVRIYLPLA